MVKLHGKSYTVKESGRKYSKNFNGQYEGGGWRIRYGLYNEEGVKVAAVVPNASGFGNVIQDGKCIGSVPLHDIKPQTPTR